MVLFTVNDVMAMLKVGILAEDAATELLHGSIVLKDRADSGDEPAVIGKKHRLVVTKLTALAGRINSSQQHVQIQNPIICGEMEAPEPDFAVVRGSIEDYADRYPIGIDTSCVIEVADSSLERDLDEKRPIYATAGVPQYIVLNLRDRTAHVFTDPDQAAGEYRGMQILTRDSRLILSLFSGSELAISSTDVLPA